MSLEMVLRLVREAKRSLNRIQKYERILQKPELAKKRAEERAKRCMKCGRKIITEKERYVRLGNNKYLCERCFKSLTLEEAKRE